MASQSWHVSMGTLAPHYTKCPLTNDVAITNAEGQFVNEMAITNAAGL